MNVRSNGSLVDPEDLAPLALPNDSPPMLPHFAGIGELTSRLFATSDRNVFREAWDAARRVPGGKRLFSRTVGRAAAYTGTIDARICELKDGFAEVTMDDRDEVRNHLQSVHAAALFTLAELCGNAALSYSLPSDARFIVAGMSIEYVKKARGPIRAVCECVVPTSSERHEYEIPVSLFDKTGTLVARSVIRSMVGPKKRR